MRPPRPRSRNDREPVDELLARAREVRRIGIGRRWQRHAERQHVPGIEAELRAHQAREASCEQRRADEQHQRGRGLRNDQQVTTAMARRAIGGAASAVTKRAQRARSRVAQRRRDAEEERGDDRGACGKREDEGIEAHLIESRDRRRREAKQRRNGGCRDEHAGHRADRGDDERFGEQLLHQPRAARAERNAHRHLALARFRANQTEVRDVPAGDEQHHDDGAEENPQRLAHVADQILEHRPDEGTVAAVAQERAVGLALDHLGHRPLHERRELGRPHDRA